ncbi:enoyl-CoA hydratase/isomerase family protein [Rhodococcus qingshengii]|uniref:enoyl-CoA hydratase/isomerase family protein n=1 Tax=Rhodococcus qingshengii TaxID=334542 RepID=UPI001C222927|nr:enoyl-CoA hydratase-related protein [Rhodococcus qingshengii]QXC46863.1 enoyl-CoA hydratase/isomerase family protein [Rhodococcus qingshengii]
MIDSETTTRQTEQSVTTEPLTVSREGAVALLRLNRPRVKNALNANLLSALNNALEEFRLDPSVRVIVLAGTGENFCAGADITAFEALRTESLFGDRAASGGTFWARLGSFPKPVIAAVEGFALGGGCEIALACDIIIAGQGARFGLPEVTLGLIPGAGGTQRLIHAVGKSNAMAMLLTGDAVSASHALGTGLVSEIVDDGQAVPQALAMATRISANAPYAVSLAKDAALASLETSLASGLEYEKRNIALALNSDDCREGESAFRDKRSPEFTGR